MFDFSAILIVNNREDVEADVNIKITFYDVVIRYFNDLPLL